MVTEKGYQLVVFAKENVRAFDLPQAGTVTIGRDAGNVIRIDDPSVSRKHAMLHLGTVVKLEDLGRSNGTFVRRTMLDAAGSDTMNVGFKRLAQRSTQLVVGDCLLFGTAYAALRHQPPAPPDADEAIRGSTPVTSNRCSADGVMQTLYAEAARAARANINVLITGETGVGKEVLAREIHRNSPRASGPFVGINCAALTESLLESELFGSEKGAFTGATTRAGLFEAGHGGTVFLDEVGELPLSVQAKLLRVLEERAITRVGATRSRTIDVRFLAATNRDLATDTRTGRMRADLFFRLNGVALVIPPLRERPLELEPLMLAFLTAACRDLERDVIFQISPAALALLRAHSWPGNVRELRNAIERAVVMCTHGTIQPEHLPAALRTGDAEVAAPAPQATSSAARPLQGELRELERRRIMEALERCGGNQSEAARQLGMPRRTLVAKLTELGVRRSCTTRPPE